ASTKIEASLSAFPTHITPLLPLATPVVKLQHLAARC
ncbi:hypothetical protein SOVF_152680, partial [Spinacia oleracea]